MSLTFTELTSDHLQYSACTFVRFSAVGLRQLEQTNPNTTSSPLAEDPEMTWPEAAFTLTPVRVARTSEAFTVTRTSTNICNSVAIKKLGEIA